MVLASSADRVDDSWKPLAVSKGVVVLPETGGVNETTIVCEPGRSLLAGVV